MATVGLRFTPLPAHVRTARLVAFAVARRAGVDAVALDEVRLAVGEACSRAVGLHARYAASEPVAVTLSDDATRFTVVVTDRGPVGAEVADDPSGEGLTDAGELIDTDDLIDGRGIGAPAESAQPDGPVELLPAGFGLAVIAGLVEDLEVSPAGTNGVGTTVRMSWPIGPLRG